MSGATTRRMATATPTPTGRLIKKIARQSSHSVSIPPSSTPTAAPAPPTAPQTPSALVRSGPWKVAVMIEGAARESIAAPSPWPAGGEEHARTAGESRGEGRDGEDAEAGEEEPSSAEHVGGAAAEQEQAAEHERVARDRPPQAAAGEPEVLLKIRQGNVHGEMSRMTISWASESNASRAAPVRARCRAGSAPRCPRSARSGE